MFLGLSVYLYAEWCMPHCPLVLASDACLTGWGIAASEVCVHEVAKICRTSERSRFKPLPNGSARASALTQAGLYDLLQAVDNGSEWVIDKKIRGDSFITIIFFEMERSQLWSIFFIKKTLEFLRPVLW